MLHKHNVDRRHHIPKMSFKVQNWLEYEAGLRRRGSLALWIEDTALECWQTCGPGGQPRYSDAAVQASLMLRTAFKLPLREGEGLLASVLTLMKLTISAPDHATVSRRAVKLPVIQPAQVPHGALHVLIGILDCRSTMPASDWRRSMARRRVGNSANCIWRSMLTAE
jgi:hypothetical protein